MYDIVIIGAGPAGLTAALYALRCGKKVLVLEGEAFGGQITMTPLVENYPGTGKISGIEFSDTLLSQVEELGGETEFSKVLKIEYDDNLKRVVTEDDTYIAKSVIIATGVKHRTLSLENEDKFLGKGVSYCAVCDGAFYKGKDIAVVGGGSSALTDALYLSDICKTVYLIHRRDAFRAEDALVKKVREKSNINLILNSVVTKLSGEDFLTSLEVLDNNSKKSTIDVSALFVMIGRIPNNEIFEGVVDMDESGYVVSTDCTTCADGVFVAGDCRTKQIRQLTTATADGTVAALLACEYLNNTF